jgi:hypothetical protein
MDRVEDIRNLFKAVDPEFPANPPGTVYFVVRDRLRYSPVLGQA